MMTETEKALSEQCQIYRDEIAQLRAALETISVACPQLFRRIGARVEDRNLSDIGDIARAALAT